MDIQIENLQKKITLRPNLIKNLIKTVLKNEGVKDASLSFVFVTAQKIRAINSKFLKHHYVTDVITFDYSDQCSVVSDLVLSITDHRPQTTLDGEVIISTDAVRQNAKQYGSAESRELVLYIVHGILHLLGYDDKKAKDKERMRVKEQEVLTRLGKKVGGVVGG